MEDLKTLEIDESRLDDITIRDVIKSFYKKAKRIHPDKAGPEYTEEFQDFKNAYERALRYLVDKNKAEESNADDTDTFPRKTLIVSPYK